MAPMAKKPAAEPAAPEPKPTKALYNPTVVLRKAKADLLTRYKVDDKGVIRDPGPFEGQPLFVAHFFEEEIADEEFTDQYGRAVAVVIPDVPDTNVFDGLVGVGALWIFETDAGFVLSRVFGDDEAERGAREEVFAAGGEAAENAEEEGEEASEGDDEGEPEGEGDEEEPDDEPDDEGEPE